LLDRAEAALRKLEGTPYEEEARLALLAIYERSRDWEHAADIARKLDSVGHGSFSGRQAHYLCEQASTFLAAGDADKALAALQLACNLAPTSARPLIDLAKLHSQRGQHQEAYDTLLQLEKAAPQALSLAAGLLVNIAQNANLFILIIELLKTHHARSPSLDVMEAIVRLEKDPIAARQWYLQHLEHEASLVAAARWIAGENLSTAQSQKLVQRALDQATKPLMRYRCAACGFEATQHFWQCPGCQAWDSYPARRVEEL
jgi:lipopolysaccharide assembly protein B